MMIRPFIISHIDLLYMKLSYLKY